MDILEFKLETPEYWKYIDLFTDLRINVLSNIKSEIEFLNLGLIF